MKHLLAFFSFMSLATVSYAGSGVGPAGCGLGNMVMGNKGNQVLAATTNGTSGSQTLGITSGTSNCVDIHGNAKLDAYIEANQVSLATDMSRGNGETLSGLTTIMQCQSPVAVHQVLKSNYKEVFVDGQESAREIRSRVQKLLSSHMDEARGCRG